MQIGIVGLGRMGSNIAKRLMRAGHECVVQDIDPAKAQDLLAEGAKTAETLAQLASLLRPPRIVWLMLPAGKITEGTVTQLGHDLGAGDTIIDGGNSFYKTISGVQKRCRSMAFTISMSERAAASGGWSAGFA